MRRPWAPVPVFLLLILLIVAGVAGAQDRPSPDDIPLYFGASFRNVTVRGEFTGDLVLSDGFQVVVVPVVGAGWGFGGLAGVDYGNFAVEFAASWSSHQGSWNGSDIFESRVAIFGMGIRWLPVHLGAVDPFVFVGCSGCDLTVIGGATDGSVFQDTTFHGIGLDLGAGVRIAVGRHLALLAQATYRWARINTVDNFYSGTATITDGLDASGFDYGAMVIFSL